MELPQIRVLVQVTQSEIESIVSGIEQIDGVESVRFRKTEYQREGQLFTRKPQSYAEIIEFVVTVVTGLGTAYIHDYLKSRGVVIKEEDKDKEKKSEDDYSQS